MLVGGGGMLVGGGGMLVGGGGIVFVCWRRLNLEGYIACYVLVAAAWFLFVGGG